jgi:C4-dicarboxylate-specific signal transduction histidine kinase
MTPTVTFLLAAFLSSVGFGAFLLWMRRHEPRRKSQAFVRRNLEEVLEERIKVLEAESHEWKASIQHMGMVIHQQERATIETQNLLARMHRLAMLQADATVAIAGVTPRIIPIDKAIEPPTWFDHLLQEDTNETTK